MTLVAALLLVSATAWSESSGSLPAERPGQPPAHPPIRPPAGAVASAHPSATAAGIQTLQAGGNAFDAAVAVSAALAVVEPYGSGIGGGGFWLLHLAADDSTPGRDLMIDGRERAPLAATRDMYLDADGRFVPERSLNGPLAAGIPGSPAALAHIAQRYGRLPLAASLLPAIELARDGFEVDAVYHRLASWRRDVLAASPAAAAQFLVDGEVPKVGTRLRQPDLAETLLRIAREGRDGFYRGPLARQLVDGVRAAGGIWTLQDLAEYRVVEREPVVGRFGDWRVVSAAPPSSGGIALVQTLNMLEAGGYWSLAPADRTHLVIESLRRAYRDRAEFLGDPDQVDVPTSRLTHPFYAAGLLRDFDLARATPSVPSGDARPRGADTTHFSVLDGDGNRVAATLSINYPFGSGFVPPGTGVLLNDEMDDFSAQPGVPNAYGLVGGDANAIAPGKRMLSSMSPTFLESDQDLVILGTPGGSRIITMVLHGILAAVSGEGGAADWVAAPRYHHQYLPDEVLLEPDALDAELRADLRARGHALRIAERPYGNMQLVHWDRAAGRVEAASDPRGIGVARVIPSQTPAAPTQTPTQHAIEPLRETP